MRTTPRDPYNLPPTPDFTTDLICEFVDAAQSAALWLCDADPGTDQYERGQRLQTVINALAAEGEIVVKRALSQGIITRDGEDQA